LNQFQFGDAVAVAFRGNNTALRYARWLLEEMGVRLLDCDDAPCPAGIPLIVAGGPQARREGDQTPVTVRLWDFHVDRPGTGVQACAVSGVSWVIGLPGQAPLYLAAHIPEKWCGTFGASAALSYFVERLTLPHVNTPSRVFDVSAAEILRGFADQNFGNHRQMPESWRRNGRISPEHGGIYPQGFFKCKDGYVAVIGRSRQDWANVLAALGDPAWATPELRNPFHLAHHSEVVDPLFCAELEQRTREELLNLALTSGATFAPLYAWNEIGPAHIVRDSFFDGDGAPGLPFEIMQNA